MNWAFLFKVLEDRNFGENFIKWVKSIYTSQKAQIIVNRDLTKPREIQKETRQGCPLSPLFFLLVLEILNRDIRQDERTVGVKIKKETSKLRVFADDLVLVLEDPFKGMEILMGKLKQFGALAGFKLINGR